MDHVKDIVGEVLFCEQMLKLTNISYWLWKCFICLEICFIHMHTISTFVESRKCIITMNLSYKIIEKLCSFLPVSDEFILVKFWTTSELFWPDTGHSERNKYQNKIVDFSYDQIRYRHSPEWSCQIRMTCFCSLPMTGYNFRLDF